MTSFWFVLVIVIILVLDIYNKANIIYTHSYMRKPGEVFVDMMVNIILLSWGMYVLGEMK